jgi:hypothetical protein
MADNQVEFEFVAQTKGIEDGLKKVESESKKTGDKIDNSLGSGLEKKGSAAFKNIAIAAAAAAAAIGATLLVTFKKSIDAAIVQEDAVNALNQALARTGQFSQAASQDFQKFASSLQSVTKFGDETILKNAALIQSLGKLSNQGLKDATVAATNLSAALGMDLASASMLVGKAATGNIAAFSRYGIVIQKGATDSETFANALRKINDQFGGAAAAQANTFSGAITQMKNAFSDVLEEIGAIITKSPALVGAIKFIKEQFELLGKEIKGIAAQGDPFKSILLGAADIAKFFTYILGPAVEIIIGSFRNASILIGGFASALVSLLSGEFKQAFETVKQVGAELIDNVVETYSFSGTKAALGFIDGFKTAVDNAPPVLEKIKNAAIEAQHVIKNITFGDVADAFSASANKIAITADSLAKILQTGLVSGIQNSFAALGGALVKGENAFAAFGKAVLSAMGAMLIQFGSMLVTVGVGLSTVPFLFGLQGPAAVAAGLAAIVAGGALQALGGGGGASPAAVGGAGASPNTGGVTSPIDGLAGQLAETEETRPQTNVAVNIQGNVLGDKRTLGREIAEALNDAFGNDGIIIARGAIS